MVNSFSLFEIAPLVTRLESRILAELSKPLTFRQYRLMVDIDNGVDTLTALASHAVISLPSISLAVRELASNELVLRRPDRKDGRSALLSLTPAGDLVLSEARTALMAWTTTLLEVVEAPRRATLLADLELMRTETRNALKSTRES